MPLTTEQAEGVVTSIKRTLRGLTVAVIACILLCLGIGAFSLVLASRIATTAEDNNTALCAFRVDVESRAKQTERFLRDHPNGIAGIPAAQLQQSLDSQRRTVLALSGLDCPG